MNIKAAYFLVIGYFLIATTCGCLGNIALPWLNSTALNLSAMKAYHRGDLEEAGVLFLQSKARFEVDRIVYPPKGTKSSSPAVLQSALSSVLGSPISRALREDPKVFLKVVRRLEKWEPSFPVGYDPGWKYKRKVGDDKVADAIEKVRNGMLPALRKQAILLSDQPYQQALAEQLASRKEASARKKELDELRRKLAAEGKPTRDIERKSLTEFRLKLLTEQQHLLKLYEIEWELVPESRWHRRVNWKAEDFFDDPQVVALCHAIENNNLKQMQALIDEGVDVNAIGMGNMTPLLWSFSDYKFERFQMLLDAGADPNVVTTSGFNIKNEKFHRNFGQSHRFLAYEQFNEGSSVNVLAYQAADTRYGWAVLKHGGDVNQVEPKTGQSPLHLVIVQFSSGAGERLEMIKALIEKGADLEYPNPYHGHITPLQMYLQNGRSGFEEAIVLVKSGANMNRDGRYRFSSPVHMALKKEADLESYKKYSPHLIPQYEELKNVMAAHGADFKTARAELNQGRAWGKAAQRQKALENLDRRVTHERKNPGGGVQIYNPSAPRYRWDDFTDRDQTKSFREYYQHTSNDFVSSPRGSSIAFSIKHVSKDDISSVENSLPEFAALGSKRILLSPSCSGHPKWLSGYGSHLVDFLRHLAVKKCQLMERTAEDFPDLPNSKAGYYFLEIANEKRHHELLIPAEYLRVRELRRDSGLEAFEEIWELIEKLKLRAKLGGQQQMGELFKAANDQLSSQYPDKQLRYYIHHLLSAELDDDGRLRCTLALSKEKDAKTQRVYSATCERVGNKLNIEITEDDVHFSDEERD